MLSSGLAASLWPSVLAYSRNESASLTREAGQGTGADAELDYRLAYHLDHGNVTAALHFATAELADEQPQAALDALKAAGEGSDVQRIRIEALLELGNVDAATATGADLAKTDTSDETVRIVALAYGVRRNQDAIAALKARVSSPEALQALSRAQAGNLPLAHDLSATGLNLSTRALLVKLPSSADRDLLLAQTDVRLGTHAMLADAASSYATSLALNPSNLAARGQYVDLLRLLKDPQDAAMQQTLHDAIANGRP